MPTNPNFATDHILVGNEGPISDEKKLTFIAASTVSLLCYEDANDVARILHADSRFRLARSLNLLSDVWAVPNVADSMLFHSLLDSYHDPSGSPLLAWSERLQTVLIGFRGTWSAADVLSDINIGQSPEPNLGSRFHAGFYARASQYTSLIEELSKRYRVVVCGHSLGGAMASIATYLVLGRDSNLQEMANAWEDAQKGLSVVTFGSPAAMVVENRYSTTALQSRWTKNFHHVINPDDPVPFALGESPKWIEKLFDIATSVRLPLRASLVMLKSWLKGRRGSFAHFGCIYLIEMADQTVQCRRVTALNQIPSIAPDGFNFRQYHSMDHYAHCLGMTVSSDPLSPSTAENDDFMTVSQFRQHCWPLPESIRESTAVIHDNCIAVTITVDSRIVQFLLKKVAFKRNGNEVGISRVEFSLKADDYNHMLVKIHHELDRDNVVESLEAIHSIRASLCTYNMFGDVTPLPVNEVQSTGLRDASVPDTFESVRLAMIMAFADQIAWVQKLKLTRGGSGDGDVDPSTLTERATQVADLVDNIVLSACPHLVVLRLQHAWEVTRMLWPKPRHEELSSLLSPDPETETGKMPGAWPEKLSLQDCPEKLKGIISGMLDKFSERGVSSKDTSIRAWEEGGCRKLGELIRQAPSLGVTLKNFSRGFHNRPTDPEERIEHAIRQADEVLSSIRFCHVIILTQLDVPPEWLWEAGLIGFFRALVFVSSGLVSWSSTIGSLAAEGTGLIAGISLIGASMVLGVGVGAGVGAVLLAYSAMQQPRQLLHNFESMVKMTMQVLGVEASPLGSIETPLAELLKGDMATSDSVKTLQKWQGQLAAGIKKHPAIKGTCRIDPTTFWGKWLFNVARIGNLRALMAKQIRIGIEGPSEAGKSELLTTVTGADPDTFRSGYGDSCRTMEIQIYKDTGRDAVFIDCPGADDKDSRIREMARLFRNIFGILIFVVPSERTRSAATEKVLKEIAVFLRDRGPDLRPVRILLSKADQLESSRTREEKIRNSVAESKRIVIRELRRLGPLSDDFVIHSRRACSDKLLLATETLDDIVQPFSTYAQMSDEGKKALSDCPENEVRKIEGKTLFHSLYNLANEGALWDIPSLRGWLRGLSPESVPRSARVWQDE